MFLAALPCLAVTAFTQQKERSGVKPQRGKPVIEIERNISLLPAQPVPVSPHPIGDGQMPARQAAKTEELPFYARHFASNGAHSRLPGVLGDRGWKLKWSAELPAKAVTIARSGSRILCQCGAMWKLFDAAGSLVREDYSGRSPVVIDPKTDLFQLITMTQSWEVRRMNSGEIAFRNALPYDESYSWPVLLRAGNRMIACARVTSPFGHEEQKPGFALIQLIELGTPIDIDPGQRVRNLKRFESLRLNVEDIRVVSENDVIAVAARDVLVLFDTGLQVKAVLTGSFEPTQLSMDESGWMYLVAGTGDGRLLWILTPDGARAATWTMLPTAGSPIQPPILGYDRRIYLCSRSELVALNPQGHSLWTQTIPGEAVGAGVTVDGRVLLSASDAVLSYKPDGEHTVLYRFNEPVATPPVYTSDHEILVGAGSRLFCLALKG